MQNVWEFTKKLIATPRVTVYRNMLDKKIIILHYFSCKRCCVLWRCQRLNPLLHTLPQQGVFSARRASIRAGLCVDAAARLVEFSLASLRWLDSLTEKQRELKASGQGGQGRRIPRESDVVTAGKGRWRRDRRWLWWYVNVRVQSAALPHVFWLEHLKWSEISHQRLWFILRTSWMYWRQFHFEMICY